MSHRMKLTAEASAGSDVWSHVSSYTPHNTPTSRQWQHNPKLPRVKGCFKSSYWGLTVTSEDKRHNAAITQGDLLLNNSELSSTWRRATISLWVREVKMFLICQKVIKPNWTEVKLFHVCCTALNVVRFITYKHETCTQKDLIYFRTWKQSCDL